MAEKTYVGPTGINEQELKELSSEKISELLEKITELQGNVIFKDFDLDGKNGESEVERKIREQLEKVEYKIDFTETLLKLTRKANGERTWTEAISETYESLSQNTSEYLSDLKDDLDENVDYLNDKKAIKNSNLSKEEQEYLLKILKEGQLILNGAKEKGSDAFDEIQENYTLLSNFIGFSYKGGIKNISQDNKKMINFNYDNLRKLQKKFDIEEKGIGTKFGRETKEVTLLTKSLEGSWTKDEAIWALKYLNRNYLDIGNRTTLTAGSDSITALDGFSDTNTFQEELIKKIIGNEDYEKGYNNEYLVGFNKNEKGNFLIKISDFEKKAKFQKATDLNSKNLAGYLQYLKEIGELNTEKLISTFGRNTLIGLGEIWKSNTTDKYSQYAKKILVDNGLENIIEEVIKLSTIISNPRDIIPLLPKDYILNIEDLKSTPLDQVKNFNSLHNSGHCPIFNIKGEGRLDQKSSEKKLKEILKLTKIYEIEQIGEQSFTNNFNILLEKRLKDSKLNEDQKNIIKEKGKLKSKDIYKSGIEKLENSEESCGFVLSVFIEGEVNNFLKENKLKILSEEERKKLLKIIAETNLKKVKEEKTQLKEKIIELKKQEQEGSLSSEGRNQLIILNTQIIDIEKKLKKAERIIVTSQASNEEREQFFKMIEEGATREEAYNNFKENRDLIQKTENINIEKTTGFDFVLSEKDYTPTESGGFYINTPSGELTISQKEKEITQNNPEALKNLINFHEFFVNLNLESVWIYRKEIIDSIGNINIDLEDSNSLGKDELINFGNNLIKFINNVSGNKIQLETNNSIGGIKNELRKYSQSNSILSSNKSFNTYGEDKFASDLRNLGIIGNSLGFQKNKFRNILEGKVEKETV